MRSVETTFLRGLTESRLQVARSLYQHDSRLSDEDLTAASETIVARLLLLVLLSTRRITQQDRLREFLQELGRLPRAAGTLSQFFPAFLQGIARILGGDIFGVDIDPRAVAVARCVQVTESVEELLCLHSARVTASTPCEEAEVLRQIERIERRIDCDVYQLYGLTDREIRIVESDQRSQQRS